jgi:hypothetical protein
VELDLFCQTYAGINSERKIVYKRVVMMGCYKSQDKGILYLLLHKGLLEFHFWPLIFNHSNFGAIISDCLTCHLSETHTMMGNPTIALCKSTKASEKDSNARQSLLDKDVSIFKDCKLDSRGLVFYSYKKEFWHFILLPLKLDLLLSLVLFHICIVSS